MVVVGGVKIGKGNPIVIQSMCTTDTKDVESTVKQILALEKAGCEIVRVAVPDIESAKALEEIKKKIHIPLVADIHFDKDLALASIPFVDKLRINPGNLDSAHAKELVAAVKKKGIPIRVGVNMGSLSKVHEKKYGRTARAMVASALEHVEVLEQLDFKDIVVSLKSTDIQTTIDAYRSFSKERNYPLHIGITEAGTLMSGSIKSAIGIGILLNEGVGDTIRVSLSGDPVNEVTTALSILRHLGLRKGLNVIACPTCARVGFDVEQTASKIEQELGQLVGTVAVMGCNVNGPGEAGDADVAIVGCNEKKPLLYVRGKYVRPIEEDEIIDAVKEALS